MLILSNLSIRPSFLSNSALIKHGPRQTDINSLYECVLWSYFASGGARNIFHDSPPSKTQNQLVHKYKCVEKELVREAYRIAEEKEG